MAGQSMTPDGVDAIRADGGLVHIRPATPADLPALEALHDSVSDRSSYFRFFSVSRYSAHLYLAALPQTNSREHLMLVASIRDHIVGAGAFDGEQGTDAAEFALLVADDRHGQGVGTLLLEHLASHARALGVRRFTADILVENTAMTHVLRDLGFRATSHVEGGVAHVEFPLAGDSALLTAIAERDRSADAASLRPLLAPRSIAVIGASARPGTVGHQVLANILRGGFTGTVAVVNPKRDSVLGVRCVPTALELPEAPDLVVVAVPAESVPGVVAQCGERGARTILLLSAGFGELGQRGRALQQETVSNARRYGMRVVGPNCVGIANTEPTISLNATFGAAPAMPGRVGLYSQSGAFGLGFIAAASRVGLGLSQFVSIGNKADVSGTDLLQFWERDAGTAVVGMYLESIADARRFARIATRVSRTKPILVVKSGRTDAGRRAGQSHTAAAATPEISVDALLRGSGVIRLNSTQELLDAARVLADQPVPAGSRLVIVGNSGGPGILAADTATATGLTVVELSESTQRALRCAVPDAASVQNPVDLGAIVGPEEVQRAVQILLDAGEADVLLTVFTQVAVSDAMGIRAAVVAAGAGAHLTLVSVEVGAPDARVVVDATSAIPVFTFCEAAASALGVAVRYGEIQRTAIPTHRSSELDLDRATARTVLDRVLADGVAWLDPQDVHAVLSAYGVPLCPQHLVRSATEAVTAAAELGYPVVAKITGTVHKSDVGGVRLDIRDDATLRRTVAELLVISRGAVLLQPMVGEDGIEAIVGAVREDQLGTLVMAGSGGVLSDVLDDRGFRLAPVHEEQADELIGELRLSRLLDGVRGAPPVSRVALRELIVRVSRLVEDFPEIAELDLNPVLCLQDRVVVADARVRVSATTWVPDPLAPQLRAARSRDLVTPAG